MAEQAGHGTSEQSPRADLHPRPQLRRERWADLCGCWGFAFDDADRGFSERWFERAEPFARQILVPYPPESRKPAYTRPASIQLCGIVARSGSRRSIDRT